MKYKINRIIYNTAFVFKLIIILIILLIIFFLFNLQVLIKNNDIYIINTYQNTYLYLTTILSMQITISFFSLTFVSILNNFDKSKNNFMRNYLLFPFKIYDLVMALIISLPLSLLLFFLKQYSLITIVFSLSLILASIYMFSSIVILFNTQYFDGKIVNLFTNEFNYVLKKGKLNNFYLQLKDNVKYIFNNIEHENINNYHIEHFKLLYSNLKDNIKNINNNNLQIAKSIYTYYIMKIVDFLKYEDVEIESSFTILLKLLKKHNIHMLIDFTSFLNRIEKEYTNCIYSRSNYYIFLIMITDILEYNYFYYLNLEETSVYESKYGNIFNHLNRSIENNATLPKEEKTSIYFNVILRFKKIYEETKNKEIYHTPIQSMLCYLVYKDYMNINDRNIVYIFKKVLNTDVKERIFIKLLVIIYKKYKENKEEIFISKSYRNIFNPKVSYTAFEELKSNDIELNINMTRQLYGASLHMIQFDDVIQFFIQLNKYFKNKLLEQQLKLFINKVFKEDYNNIENNDKLIYYFEPIKNFLIN